ncbi:tRNA (guanine-N7-)-methyltransferase [Stackebrandtia endophytica]|uniref:tRNA (guanine-N(7)-)-methyltransferase n=1 Tax=Stackebrandtia endophytica TaxID=1496996 RepID=A0A543AX05_9ACTN|nr:tRNA (guanosine(46)-N7)-methyltransferase TrmB [Stackebrandtia endophytica]TQL77116.1 tRNA (guanine-N7-)-methyltransferase [Stackebrandtia endophytica]
MSSTIETRTYYPRRGRVSLRHHSALETLYPRYGVPAERVDNRALFGRDHDVVLEIGSGMGEASLVMAQEDPRRDYIAVEVHPPGIGNLLALIEEHSLTNLRVHDGDAISLLTDHVPDGALSEIRVFFPDPWPKARHHKRRIIRPAYAALMRSKLRSGGVLRCATDWADYAEVMLEVLSADPGLRNRFERESPRPRWRPVTKFEQRAVEAGRGITDLCFDRVG